MQGLITDIQRFSIHDGPGIRTTVFLKGCNLRCAWCHNPETICAQPELEWAPARCIGCGACVLACPQGNGPVASADGGPAGLRRDGCTGCGACARECFAEARSLVGRRVTVDQVLAEVLADRPFFEESAGGVTLSGGEPLVQLDFTLALLIACRAAGIHTAVETNLCAPAAWVKRLLPLVDLVMADVKHVDSARHRELTGVENTQVWPNLRLLADAGVPLIVRTPVIPGYNDDPATIAAIAHTLGSLQTLHYYELLPYHPLGEGKRQALGLPPSGLPATAVSREALHPLAEAAAAAGVPVRVAGRVVASKGQR
jgi:pyruvate formate lyase activating enzyme